MSPMLFLGCNASANTIRRFRKTKHTHLEVCDLQPEAPRLHPQRQTLFPDVAHAVGHRFNGGSHRERTPSGSFSGLLCSITCFPGVTTEHLDQQESMWSGLSRWDTAVSLAQPVPGLRGGFKIQIQTLLVPTWFLPSRTTPLSISNPNLSPQLPTWFLTSGFNLVHNNFLMKFHQ